MRKQYSNPCQFCGAAVMRSGVRAKSTCFGCKIERQRKVNMIAVRRRKLARERSAGGQIKKL